MIEVSTPLSASPSSGVRLLYPGSSLRNPSFQERLEQAGISVVGLSVYTTETRPDIARNLGEWAKRKRTNDDGYGTSSMTSQSDSRDGENLIDDSSNDEKENKVDESVYGGEIKVTPRDFLSLPLSPLLAHPIVCVFFSPSGVKAASAAFEILQWPVDEILHVAVGPTTLKALDAKGVRRKTMASKPNPESVVQAIVDSFKT